MKKTHRSRLHAFLTEWERDYLQGKVQFERSPKVSVGAKERQLKWKLQKKLYRALDDFSLLEEWLTDVPIEQQQVLPTVKEWKRWFGSPRTDKSVVIPVTCPKCLQPYEVRISQYGKIETTT